MFFLVKNERNVVVGVKILLGLRKIFKVCCSLQNSKLKYLVVNR